MKQAFKQANRPCQTFKRPDLSLKNKPLHIGIGNYAEGLKNEKYKLDYLEYA